MPLSGWLGPEPGENLPLKRFSANWGYTDPNEGRSCQNEVKVLRKKDMNPSQKLLSTREVAEFLGVHEKMVYALISDKGLPATKITGKWLFPLHLV
ncbi:MAG TPA: helix-turn-helix domain-containing protein, partial [Desulfosalsimonadaceae bacterium]|nr:helix-turn-helix domain-containing protein [Desulfosalsimonadaceae bacterium]